MRLLRLSPATAVDAVAVFEALEAPALAVLRWPRCVYLGLEADVTANVSVDDAARVSVPVVRGIAPGRGYCYDVGHAIWLVLATNHQPNIAFLGHALLRAMQALGIEAFYDDNDVRVGDRRVAMVAPPRQRMDGSFVTVGEILLDTDFSLANSVMRYPADKWAGKPVSRIEDWLLPLKQVLGLDAETKLDTPIRQALQEELGVTFTLSQPTQAEQQKVVALRAKYSDAEWTSRGWWPETPRIEEWQDTTRTPQPTAEGFEYTW
jgi:lipoate-protein ligase A